jgi:uncharacterized protein (DUF433 family)
MTTTTIVIKPEITLRSRYVTTNPEILQGEPIIEGTIVAVRDIVQLWNAGIQPQAMLPELFHQVTIAQIFDALSFYTDHPEQVDRYIAQYAGHPAPLLRLSPSWDDMLLGIQEYRQEIDAEMNGEPE